MSRPFPILFYPLSVILGLVLAVLLLEGVFQLMPVGNAVLLTEVDEKYRVKHYKPHSTVRTTRGWDFAYRTDKRSNNLGYLNDHDCIRADTPLMTIIGDSYVEALQVRNMEAHHGLLHAGLQGLGQVCGIGTSGSPLSNYLIYAQFARNKLSSEAMAFVIVGNDFDESMCKYFNMGAGMWCFDEKEHERFDLVPGRQPPNRLRDLGRYSALLRYIAFNLQVNWRDVFGKIKPGEAATAAYVGNVPAQVSSERIRYSRLSVDLFLKQLPEKSGLSTDRIMFVVDAIRQDIYSGNSDSSRSFYGQMRKYFVDSARAHDYEVIDMQPLFMHDYSVHGEKYEYPIDGHWNKLGHYLAATAIARSTLFAKTFGKEMQLDQRPLGLVY